MIAEALDPHAKAPYWDRPDRGRLFQPNGTPNFPSQLMSLASEATQLNCLPVCTNLVPLGWV